MEGWLDWCRASGLAPGKRQQASAVQGPSAGLLRRGSQTHSVRRESCNSDSSPEPAAACSEGACWERGWYGGRAGALRAPREL
jgi:hypothetical protein